MRRRMRMGPGTTTPMVRILLIVNAAVFFIQFFFPRMGLTLRMTPQGPIVHWFGEYFALIPVNVITRGFLWQFITYQFLHGGIFHIIINMFVLWMFGVELESRWGSAGFLRFYLICGIAGGLAMTLINPLGAIPVIGASGAVLGLLGAYAVYWPERMVYVWGIFPLKVKQFVFIIGAVSLLAGMSEAQEGGIAHMAHLGGVLMGLVYCKYGDPRKPLLGFIYNWYKKLKIRDKKSEWDYQRKKRKEILKEADEILDKMEDKDWEDLSPEQQERIKEIADILDGFPSRPSGRR